MWGSSINELYSWFRFCWWQDILECFQILNEQIAQFELNCANEMVRKFDTQIAKNLWWWFIRD